MPRSELDKLPNLPIYEKGNQNDRVNAPLRSFLPPSLTITRLAEEDVHCNNLRLAELAHELFVGRFASSTVLSPLGKYEVKRCEKLQCGGEFHCS